MIRLSGSVKSSCALTRPDRRQPIFAATQLLRQIVASKRLPEARVLRLVRRLRLIEQRLDLRFRAPLLSIPELRRRVSVLAVARPLPRGRPLPVVAGFGRRYRFRAGPRRARSSAPVAHSTIQSPTSASRSGFFILSRRGLSSLVTLLPKDALPRANRNPKPIAFPRCKGRRAVARSSGGAITSDAGVTLSRRADQRLGPIERAARELADPRRQASCGGTWRCRRRWGPIGPWPALRPCADSSGGPTEAGRFACTRCWWSGSSPPAGLRRGN